MPENTITGGQDVNAGAREPVAGINPALCRLNPKIGMHIKLVAP